MKTYYSSEKSWASFKTSEFFDHANEIKLWLSQQEGLQKLETSSVFQDFMDILNDLAADQECLDVPLVDRTGLTKSFRWLRRFSTIELP